MNLSYQNSDKKEIYLKSEQISSKIKDYCDSIRSLLANNTDNYCFVVVLKGAAQFFFEFYKHLNLDINYTFVKCRSYLNQTQESTIDIDILFNTAEVKGKQLIIVDDIYDSGRTLNKLTKIILNEYTPMREIWYLFLLKRSKNKKNLSIFGKVDNLFTVTSDRWLIGYGMDTNNRFRFLKNIYFAN